MMSKTSMRMINENNSKKIKNECWNEKIEKLNKKLNWMFC